MTDVNSSNRSGKQQKLAVKDMLLDAENPRFGDLGAEVEQKDIVDLIVRQFGIEDVLSSIAVNGFFSAEPLICKVNKNGKIIVAEGNRRLTACIILTDDPRGSAFKNISLKYKKIWEENKKPSIEPIPVILFEDEQDDEELLSYLGVRHIASAQPWDSYAKAAWVSRITRTTSLSVSEVSQMIGDQHNTVLRLLEGYNFIQQLIKTGKFHPQNSVRKGRGSVSEYPFSWIYTLLGYRSARNYIGLQEITDKENPIPDGNEHKGEIVVNAMFGNTSTGRNSAVTDSRQLVQLASVFADEDKIRLLLDGKNVDEIENATKPIERRLSEGFSEARDIFSNLLTGLSEQPIDADTAQRFVTPASRARSLASDVEKKLRAIVIGDE